jgi:DNA invertase Pin-like site-specific DNA recombinase
MRVFGYVRLSQESDRSIASQREDIIRECQTLGYELVQLFDEGERSSGFSDDRPEYQRMLKAIRDGAPVDLVMVRDMARFGRTMKERIYQVLHLERLGVHVYNIEKHKLIDPDNPQDLLLENVEAFADDVKKRSEIEKSKAELEKKKRLGHPLGRPPFGLRYTKDKAGFEPAEGFEKALRVIELREEDPRGNSFPRLAEELALPQTTVYRIWRNRQVYTRLEQRRTRG